MAVKYRHLLQYVALNYIDKLVVFVLPLAVLFVTGDEAQYNDIEYILSAAGILVPLTGVAAMYSFYGFSRCDDRERYLRELDGYFNVAQAVYIVVGAVVWFAVRAAGVQAPWVTLYVFIVARTLYLLFFNFLNARFRLLDRPSKVFMYSIPVNVVSMALILLSARLEPEAVVTAFFLPQAVVAAAGLAVYFVRAARRGIRPAAGARKFYKEALIYSLPLIVSTLTVAFVTNYGKIYAYGNLSQYDMYSFSYTMRLNMIIHMAHVSLIAYYSKRMYVDRTPASDRRVATVYALFIGAAVAAAFVLLLLFNRIPGMTPIRIDLSTLFVLLYTLLHCTGAFLELFYNRTHRNGRILIYSLISCAVYAVLMFGVGVGDVTDLGIYMTAYMVVYVVLLAAGLGKGRLADKIRSEAPDTGKC